MNIVRAGRPPDERDGDYLPAPDWDKEFIEALVQQWHEPVVVTSDCDMLRSMSLYALGTSVQVSVLGKDHIARYMGMALTVANKAFVTLQTVIGNNDPLLLDQYWRYPTLITYIEQKQARAILQCV